MVKSLCIPGVPHLLKKKKKGIQKTIERHICSVEKSYHVMVCFLGFMPVFLGQKMTEVLRALVLPIIMRLNCTRLCILFPLALNIVLKVSWCIKRADIRRKKVFILQKLSVNEVVHINEARLYTLSGKYIPLFCAFYLYLSMNVLSQVSKEAFTICSAHFMPGSYRFPLV